jgi:hypothetical protein
MNKLEGLQPLLRAKALKLVDVMEKLGKPVVVTEGLRTIERQNALYEQGRTTPGQVVTNAKGGQSLHNYGVAFDVVFREGGYNVPADWWKELGEEGEELGLEWGGRWVSFPDRPHFQLLLGYRLSDFQNKKVDYSKYGVIPKQDYKFKRDLKRLSTGEDVKVLQEYLKLLGFFPKETSTVESFGPVTEQAVKEFKASRVNGVFDEETRKALMEEIKKLK